jgi:hypothetical protein
MPNIIYVAGSATYLAAQGINSTLAAAYGTNFLDVWTPLIAAYNSGNLLDTYDHSIGIVPGSLRAQSVSTITGSLGATGCSFTVAGAVAPLANIEAQIDSEFIFITAVSGQNVTNCTRGYAASTAATHSASAPFTSYDNIHLNNTGYALWASAVWTWLSTRTPNYLLGSHDFQTLLTQGLITATPGTLHLTSGNLVATNSDTSLGLISPYYLFLKGLTFNFVNTAGAMFTQLQRAGDGSAYWIPTTGLTRFSGTLLGYSGVGPSNNAALLWTTGASAPSGACTSGSLYTRTDATGGLYACQNAAWVAH